MADPLDPGVGAILLLSALVALWGLLLGAVFYGGLWWTVHHAMALRRPALWVAASMLLRMGAALGGFYAAGRGEPERLLPCLIGFLTARALVTWATRLRAAAPHPLPAGHRHAP